MWAALCAAALLARAPRAAAQGTTPQILHTKRGVPLKTTLTKQTVAGFDPLAVCNDGTGGACAAVGTPARRVATAPPRRSGGARGCARGGRGRSRVLWAAAAAARGCAAYARAGALSAPAARAIQGRTTGRRLQRRP